MIRYYVNRAADAPEAVECTKVGYPNRDDKGRMQWDNSHFDGEGTAWEELQRDTAAEEGLAIRNVERYREWVAGAEVLLGEATLHCERVKRGMDARKREARP